MSRDFVGALLQLNAEKQVPREQLIRTVEEAIQSAYRRVAGDEDIHVAIDAETGKIRVYRARYVVAEIEDELTELTVDQAKAYVPDAKVGDLVETEQLDGDVFGRIGAQTAKQVVLQRLREAERDVVFDQFASREGELITGTVNRVEPRAIALISTVPLWISGTSSSNNRLRNPLWVRLTKICGPLVERRTSSAYALTFCPIR